MQAKQIETRNEYSVSQRFTLGVCLFLLLFALVVYSLASLVESRAWSDLKRKGNSRATFSTQTLKDSLEKYRHLPYVLARDARIRDLLKGKLNDIKVNPHLEDFSHATGAMIFVLDKHGTTRATSNWRTPQSLLGYNYSFRPYFLDAKDGKPGIYYAVGMQTRLPGFFISYPVLEVGELLGVVVVKVNLLPLQKTWTDGNETIMVSDAYGVVILTSNDQWGYKSLQPLSSETRSRLRIVQYLDTSLDTLPIKRNNTNHGNILTIGDKEYLEISRQLPSYGWRLHYLTEIEQVGTAVKITVFISTGFFLFLSLLLLYFRERKQRLISRQEAKDAREIKELNLRLQEEIIEHQQTEHHLRDTQKELIQAGKLAALGRMSAAVAHELNQPVTAIRTFLASCKVFITRNQIDNVEKNIVLISDLTDRMARITGQLKTFASKNKGHTEKVDLSKSISRVLEFTTPQLEKSQIQVTTTLPGEGKAIVLGDTVRIEQVITNLIKNGMDAVKESSRKEIYISLVVQEQRVIATFEDSGTGIEQETLENLFEPFYTTKDSGEGLGLGLSISYAIVQDANGTISVENREDGGARFVLDFPLSNSTSQPDFGDTL